MTELTEEDARFKDDTSSILDLLLTKEPSIVDKVMYKCPIGKCNHVTIEFTVREKREKKKDEQHRKERFMEMQNLKI